ncbi:hypothetical protein [Candidatus Electronema sp. PJ]
MSEKKSPTTPQQRPTPSRPNSPPGKQGNKGYAPPPPHKPITPSKKGR